VLYVARKVFSNALFAFHPFKYYGQKFFFSLIFSDFFLVFLKNGSSDIKLNFKVYSPLDSSTFNILPIVVKSLVSKLIFN